jgi:hypothetical protein
MQVLQLPFGRVTGQTPLGMTAVSVVWETGTGQSI